MRKLASLFLIITIFVFSFVMPFIKASQFSYAAGDVNSWHQVTTTEQAAEAFRYYCKSRDLTIEGSALDILTSFTTDTYKSIVRAVGLDMDAIQADIKYTTDQNGNLKFLFNATGISAMNRIFSQFLQDNDLEVGQAYENEQIWHGIFYKGNRVGITTTSNGNALINDDKSNLIILDKGSTYDNFDDIFLRDHINTNYTVTPFETDLTFNVKQVAGSNTYVTDYKLYYNSKNVTVYSNFHRDDLPEFDRVGGHLAYYIVQDNPTKIYFGYLAEHYDYNVPNGVFTLYLSRQVVFNMATYNRPDNLPSGDVYVTTGDTVINNNTYEGNTYTTINNEGDTNNYYGDEEPDPDQPVNPDPGNDPYNPYPDGGGTVTDPNQTGGGDGDDDTTITFPNFNFDLPSIDWSLGDLSEKFPFSIPFDLIAFFTVLNAEPEAPEIEADIPLGTWYTWHFNADFSQFDNYAVIMRNVEFIAFCVGLIYLTIKFVKG